MNNTITGFVAWHPEEGAIGCGTGFLVEKTREAALFNLCVCQRYFKRTKLFGILPDEQAALATGWQIREVEISFKD